MCRGAAQLQHEAALVHLLLYGHWILAMLKLFAATLSFSYSMCTLVLLQC